MIILIFSVHIIYVVIAALYHKERVLSKKGAIKSLQGFIEGWYNRLFYEVKDSGFYCAARLVHTLNQCGLFDVVEKARAFCELWVCT